MPRRPAALAALLAVLSAAGTAAAQQQQQPKGTLARIKQEGVLRWGADGSGGGPFVYKDPKDPSKVIGFEVDLVEAIAKHLGVRAELRENKWEALIEDLRSGRIDLALNGLEINGEKRKEVFFTTPYYIYEQQLTVRGKDKDKYRTLEDLKGKPIAVLNGSESVRVLERAGWPKNLIRPYEDSLAPYTELRLGRVEAALAESIIATFYASEYEDLYSLPKTFSPGLYGGAVRRGDEARRGDEVRRGDEDLLEEINRIIEKMKRSGELGTIYRRGKVWTPLQEQLAIDPGVGGEAAGGEGRGVALLLLQAAGVTLLLTAISMPLALTFGLGLALMSRSRNVLVSGFARVYIQVIRGTPLLVQLYLIYFTLPQLSHLLGLGDLLTWPAFLVGVICLSANYAAYEAEIHRAGIEAVPRGQREAALSLGMSERQAFRRVVLPQSFRIILPPVLNDLISMLKDSSLVSVISVQELLTVATGIGRARFMVPEFLAIAAGIYLVMSLLCAWLGKRLEERLKRRGAPTLSTGPAAHH